MTEEIYPNKDIKYMPDKTPVYIITDKSIPEKYDAFLKTKRSFQLFGYRDVRRQDPVYPGERIEVAQDEFPRLVFRDSTDIEELLWLTHLRLWKKCLGLNAPIIVVPTTVLLNRDIPNNRSNEGIVGLGGQLIPGVRRGQRSISVRRGYLLYPDRAKGLLSWANKKRILPADVDEIFWRDYAGCTSNTQRFPPQNEYVINNDQISRLDT